MVEPREDSETSWQPGTGAADPSHRCRGAAGVHRCTCPTGEDHGPGECGLETVVPRGAWLPEVIVHVAEPLDAAAAADHALAWRS